MPFIVGLGAAMSGITGMLVTVGTLMMALATFYRGYWLVRMMLDEDYRKDNGDYRPL